MSNPYEQGLLGQAAQQQWLTEIQTRHTRSPEEQLEAHATNIEAWLDECTPEKIEAKRDELDRIRKALAALKGER